MTGKRKEEIHLSVLNAGMEARLGDSETQRVLSLWKGKRFLKSLRKVCGLKEKELVGEANRR